ncbi:MAG: hypothetical protein KA066_00895 [Candidatus Pacebacteria bacterium]|nr:hypothetical protein [Candidatus Paceibacterota bacterium]
MQQTITTNHEEIRAWAAGRGGMPAIVDGTEAGLRFDWGEDDNLMRLSWPEFFEIFDEQGLAFAHIEEDDSSVYEFVPRHEARVYDNG